MVKRPSRKLHKEKVYRIVKLIPFGSTSTYKKIAKKIGSTNPRAIGRILSQNSKLIAIPCHRVIRSDGKTGGYAAGENFKKFLLEWEKNIVD
ncbi:MAG: MGMT family protein [Candidatus Omnitrophica bacterium]|nr:MGMT family protein [Candidatus Omnitrophota bacterium]MCM8815961.1 MGMT family protein [Candidatus Omnitrophota bacterium]